MVEVAPIPPFEAEKPLSVRHYLHVATEGADTFHFRAPFPPQAPNSLAPLDRPSAHLRSVPRVQNLSLNSCHSLSIGADLFLSAFSS